MNVRALNHQPEEGPNSIEAEQQLLGAIMVENSRLSDVQGIITADDFFDPVHQRVFSAISARIERDELASPVTMKLAMAHDEGLRELGGGGYLVRMAGASVAGSQVREYAKLIRDAAARRETLNLLREASEALKAGSKPAGDVMADLEAALVSMAPASTKMRPQSMLSAVTSAVQQMDDAYHGRQVPSVGLPWGALGAVIPSFRAGDMIVLGGRPSMGKSAVALSVATYAAMNGHPVVFASFEMTPEDVAMRAMSEATSEAGKAVPYQDMAGTQLQEQQYRQSVEVAQMVSRLPIQFLTEDFRRPGALLAGTKQALRAIGPMEGKTPLIIVDYMQLMEGRGRDLREQITDISKQMKHLAKNQNAAVVALSQLSRNVESRQDKRPMLSDLRESGQIEQDADTIIFCYRDEYYIERERPDTHDVEAFQEWEDRLDRSKGKLELIVGKQRRGPIGTAHLRCALKFNRIWE